MGYVTDSIQFRTAFTTPLEVFATGFNKIRDNIVASGMQQVSLEDWPDQVGSFVTGTASGNDYSLDDLVPTKGWNALPVWVFKHPTLKMYVKVEPVLIAGYYDNIIRIPSCIFYASDSIDPGQSKFSGSEFGFIMPAAIATSSTGTYNSAIWSTSSYPTNTYLLRTYCGDSGFWITSNGGQRWVESNSSDLAAYVYPEMPLIAFALLVDDSKTSWAMLSTPNHSVVTNNNAPAAGPMITAQLYEVSHGVRLAVFLEDTWRAVSPGDLGTLDCPTALTTDRGVRVAQAQIYGAGKPKPLPLGIVQATLPDTVIRLDLDGSGERDWMPSPYLQHVILTSNAPAPLFHTQHCIYALPVSDD